MTARYKSLPLKIVSIVVLGLGLLVGIRGGATASKDGQTLSSSRSEAVSDSLNAQALDTLHVLVMLPFGLGVDTLPGGSLPRKTIRLREIALESLHGLECAALELAGKGLPVELIVSDEIPDSTGRILLSQRDLVRSDVVVGPLMRENLAALMPRIDRLRKEHILLTEQPPRHVERGTAVRQAVASEVEAAGLLAELVASRHDTDHVMLVVTGGSDALLEQQFHASFDAVQKAKWESPIDSMRYELLDTVNGSTRSVGQLALRMTPYERNVVVGLAGRNSRSMWAALQTELQMNDSSDIVLFAHPELAEMPFVDGQLMEDWRLTLPRTNQIQWSDTSRWESLEAYRTLVGVDPGKYATLAHDALLDAGQRRFQWIEGVSWAQPIVWTLSPDSLSWHNTSWEIVRFEDLQWKPVDSCQDVEPFVPRLFYTEEDSLIPVPFDYQHLFPEEYPMAKAPSPRP